MEQYDYIVVGGGSAGCVTASRLVREFGARVLLLESGPPDHHRLIDMPAGFVKLLFRPNPFVTVYQSEPQPPLDNGRVTIMQGHVLGGGSSVNAMTYTRGVPSDYTRWNEAVGGAGWGWDDLLPYFKKHECNQRLNNHAHGIDGPLKVSDAHHPICDASRAFLHTLQTLDVAYVSDVNGGSQDGVSLVQSTTYKGKRCSAARAFLEPVRNDPRLTLKCNADALRVLFQGTRAVGVEFSSNAGSPETAYARAEVILTAGAYGSPKLLLLSGIGPAADLTGLGIKVRVDLPGIGRNMQDHNSVALVARTNGAYGYCGEDRGTRMLVNGLQYMLFGSGPVASTASEVMAFVRSDPAQPEADLQLYCAPVMIPSALLPPQQGHGITLIANLVRPISRGSMRLRSADAADPPIINPNYFADPADLQALVRGLRYLRTVAETTPLNRMIEDILSPQSSLKSDAELGAYCKAVTTTNFHPVGSCRMGPDSDALAVLAPDLRVRDVENLRVFDASMMPSVISANTNAPVMAIADRAVDLMMNKATLALRTGQTEADASVVA